MRVCIRSVIRIDLEIDVHHKLILIFKLFNYCELLLYGPLITMASHDNITRYYTAHGYCYMRCA